MKFLILPVLCIMLSAITADAGEKLELKDKRDRVSYSIGANIATTLKNQSIDVNLEALLQGIKDTLMGDKTLMSQDEMDETLKIFQGEMSARKSDQLKEVAEKNKKEGEAFLAENKTKEGIVTLPSGLQYKVLSEGTGESPTANDTVSINYQGSLIDGTEFDSSFKRGHPAVLRVNGVIPGLSEALQLMKVGSRWRIFIPSELAYGERGVGRTIGPNQTLIFEVELISFEKGMKFHTDEMFPR
ncbi:MAG: FKBP-type peptidyl-prolyl cis-trans isomerase [Nitrospirota bacterium]